MHAPFSDQWSSFNPLQNESFKFCHDSFWFVHIFASTLGSNISIGIIEGITGFLMLAALLPMISFYWKIYLGHNIKETKREKKNVEREKEQKKERIKKKEKKKMKDK